MNWVKPEHGSRRINAAGNVLAIRCPPNGSVTEDVAFSIAGNWRSAHGYPLQVMGMTLRNRAERIDHDALVFQRLKRLSSIVRKLQRFPNMQLSQMHDLGGCRAVVQSIDLVRSLVHLYESNACNAARFHKKYDYVIVPKPDGYRGVHLVYKYSSRHSQRSVWNGLRIEIQIRSRLQHAWATAVETIDTFTNQAIKTGLGSQEWRRFFALIGTAMASVEESPIVPGTPRLYAEIVAEARHLKWKLRAEDVFLGLTAGMDIAPQVEAAASYILMLDSVQKKTTVLGFDDNRVASDRYMEVEKDTAGTPQIQAVLVSVTSVAALRRAYPNYYLDTQEFLAFLKSFLSEDDEEI